MSSVRPHRPALRAAFAATLGVFAAVARSPVGLAAAPCPISLVPEDAGGAWEGARRDAEARLARLAEPHDCRVVEVSVRPDGGATLAFLTTDGRGAARALESPADLVPALEALLVTRLAPVPAPTPPAPPEPAPPAPLLRPAAPAMGSRARRAASPPTRVTLGGALGGRLAFGDTTHLAPVASLRASATLAPWELGVFAEVAPLHEPLSFSAPEGFALSSFATGIAVGRRESSARVAFAYGLSMSVASVNEEADDLPELTQSRAVDLAEPRIGGYGRLAFPAASSPRVAAELGFDAAFGRLRKGAAANRQLPALPRFGLGLTVGVEVDVL
jgi:hypothetical protein